MNLQDTHYFIFFLSHLGLFIPGCPRADLGQRMWAGNELWDAPLPPLRSGRDQRRSMQGCQREAGQAGFDSLWATLSPGPARLPASKLGAKSGSEQGMRSLGIPRNLSRLLEKPLTSLKWQRTQQSSAGMRALEEVYYTQEMPVTHGFPRWASTMAS